MRTESCNDANFVAIGNTWGYSYETLTLNSEDTPWGSCPSILFVVAILDQINWKLHATSQHPQQNKSHPR